MRLSISSSFFFVSLFVTQNTRVYTHNEKQREREREHVIKRQSRLNGITFSTQFYVQRDLRRAHHQFTIERLVFVWQMCTMIGAEYKNTKSECIQFNEFVKWFDSTTAASYSLHYTCVHRTQSIWNEWRTSI